MVDQLGKPFLLGKYQVDIGTLLQILDTKCLMNLEYLHTVKIGNMGFITYCFVTDQKKFYRIRLTDAWAFIILN